MKLFVTFRNGARTTIHVIDTHDAYAKANHMSKRTLARIELETEPNSLRALWDHTWTPLSQATALEMPA